MPVGTTGNRAGSIVRAMRASPAFPERYVWYVLVGFLDLIMTNTLMTYFGAIEANRLADAVIRHGGFAGLIAFKSASMVLVISICEFVARRKRETAGKLATAAVVLSAVPVVAAALQLAVYDPDRHMTPEVAERLVAWAD